MQNWWQCPDNWQDLTIFPDIPTVQSRAIYQIADGVPFNGIACSVDVAEMIWPGGEGTLWAIDPMWVPDGYVGRWPTLDMTQPIWPPPIVPDPVATEDAPEDAEE